MAKIHKHPFTAISIEKGKKKLSNIVESLQANVKGNKQKSVAYNNSNLIHMKQLVLKGNNYYIRS